MVPIAVYSSVGIDIFFPLVADGMLFEFLGIDSLIPLVAPFENFKSENSEVICMASIFLVPEFSSCSVHCSVLA